MTKRLQKLLAVLVLLAILAAQMGAAYEPGEAGPEPDVIVEAGPQTEQEPAPEGGVPPEDEGMLEPGPVVEQPPEPAPMYMESAVPYYDPTDPANHEKTTDAVMLTGPMALDRAAAGCVSIPEGDMLTLLRAVEPECVTIIDTPEGVRGY